MVTKKSALISWHFVVLWDNHLKHNICNLALEEQRIECCLAELNRAMKLAGECVKTLTPQGLPAYVHCLFSAQFRYSFFLLVCQHLLKGSLPPTGVMGHPSLE